MPLFALVELSLEVLRCVVVDDEEAFALVVALLLFFCFLTLYDLDIVLLRQILQGIRVGELLVLHDEVQGRTPFSTREAFADILGWIDVEGRVSVAVEGTQTYVAYPLAA